ncbi:MAG: DJ-1/PfpI family protein, partial [Sphingomicrobium sp.]
MKRHPSEPPPLSVAFLLFPQVTQLDLTGPAQVLSRMGNTTIHLVAKTRDPVQTDSGFAILPTDTFDDVLAANILCVPGGFGDQDAMEDDATLEWLRLVGGHADWVTSVCTGALVLGAAGLLRGYRATTHWASHSYLASFGA